MVNDETYDVVIAGCGAGGLYTALNLPSDLSILMIAKTEVDECDSMLAQGGICVLHDEDDYQAFFNDTLRAGHGENRHESVDIMIRSSRAVINDLIDYGVDFARTETGELAYTREAAHCLRICFHEDTTGKEITTPGRRRQCAKRSSPARTRPWSTSSSRTMCCGIIAEDAQGDAYRIRARFTVMATGGIGGLDEHSTNFPSLTGDACRIAREHGVELENMDYVQIDQTSLYTGRPGRAFLDLGIVSRRRRDPADRHNRFTDELQPRDVVSAAIKKQMEAEGSKHVWLSFENIEPETIHHHFPSIYQKCLEEGYDITKEPIPVVPAQHYFMGGVHVDSDSQTTMQHLFAVGETSCNGVHGANRLASNSLLESLVFAKRAAQKIVADRLRLTPRRSSRRSRCIAKRRYSLSRNCSAKQKACAIACSARRR